MSRNIHPYPVNTVVMARARLVRPCDLSSVGLAIAATLLVLSFTRFISLASDAAYEHIEVHRATHQATGRRQREFPAHPIRQRGLATLSHDVACEPHTIPLVGRIELQPDVECASNSVQPLCVPLVCQGRVLPHTQAPLSPGSGCLQ